MSSSFTLTDEQKKAFEAILSNRQTTTAEVSKQSAKFDAFSSLLGPEKVLTEVKSKLPASFKGQALFSCDATNSKELFSALSKLVFQNGETPVLVLFNGNYKGVASLLSESGVYQKFFVIDCVSKSISNAADFDGVMFIDSLRNLTQLQIKIVQFLKEGKKVAFVFDSIWPLTLYHGEDVVLKFMNSITKLLRKNNVSAYYISSNKPLYQKLSQFFDESVEIKKFM
jgi:hypothetical protein